MQKLAIVFSATKSPSAPALEADMAVVVVVEEEEEEEEEEGEEEGMGCWKGRKR